MKKTPSESKNWPAQVVLVTLGLSFAGYGILVLKLGYWWQLGYNAHLGRFGITPTAQFVAIGLIFMLIGVVPWNRISSWLERRDARRRRKDL